LLDETLLFRPIGGVAMRLIHRNRHHQRGKLPRIAISQEEITADLHYPAGRRASRLTAVADARRSGGR
jgi:hypothetical protein